MIFNGLYMYLNKLDHILFLETYMDIESEFSNQKSFYYVTNRHDNRDVYGLVLDDDIHLNVTYSHQIDMPLYKVVRLDIKTRNIRVDEIKTFKNLKVLFSNGDEEEINNSIIRVFPRMEKNQFSWRSGSASNTGEGSVVYTANEAIRIIDFTIPNYVKDFVQVKLTEQAHHNKAEFSSVDDLELPIDVDYSFKLSTCIEPKSCQVIDVFFRIETEEGSFYLYDVSSTPNLEYESIRAYVKENR